MLQSTITLDELQNEVDKWAIETYGNGFKFRDGQKEIICSVIYDWLNGTKSCVLDAPTGSGKSIIAMSVAGILAEKFGKKGYIVISDLSLLDQYAADIEQYFPHWAVIKGQDNYSCSLNGMIYKLGACKLAGCKTPRDIRKYYPGCLDGCEYIVSRRKAAEAPVTLCTYSFWLLHRNMDNEHINSESQAFGERDFTICDEAHKTVSITQSHFSPVISEEDREKLNTLLISTGNGASDLMESTMKALNNIIFSCVGTFTNDQYAEFIDEYAGSLASLHNVLLSSGEGEKINVKKKPSSKDIAVMHAKTWFDDYACSVIEYNRMVKRLGSSIIVWNSVPEKKTVILNCLDESYLMLSKFIMQANRLLFMSATIGDFQTYAEYNKIAGNYKAYHMPNAFDYSKSPIYYVPNYKMSFAEKEASFPYISCMARSVMNMYSNSRGIIQTASYSVAKQFYESLPLNEQARCYVYDTSEKKGEALDSFKCTPNGVLIGPSLVEGLSLDDDLCRFQIIMKMPYSSIADKFVAAKMKNDPMWYANKTAITLLQGVGRGVRNANDWCVTFILDGCFDSLYGRCQSMFPEEFRSRLVIIPPTTLITI